MTNIIPSLSSCLPRMTGGEKRLGRRLESHLEDDYLVWFDTPVGGRQRYTDFIILHPRRGLLLLEVKDWKLDSIQKFDRQSFTLLTPNGIKHATPPLEQVRQCSYQLVKALEADTALRQLDGKYEGRLACPYAFGVVLANISRAEFQKHDFDAVIPQHLAICKDEMQPSVDAEDFQKRLWDMFSVQFKQALSLPQIDRVRWHLFPEIRIQTQTTIFDKSPETDPIDTLFPDIIRVMDKNQERLARSLGQGHRVIHGVAGSGKTLILGYRCQQLAKQLKKPILVLCFNVVLAAKLRETIKDSGIADQVDVRHFHEWCGEQLKTYNIDKPPFSDNYVNDIVSSVIDGVAKGQIPSGQYGAVMIDEGHDFEPSWLKLVVGMVDPDTNSLLLLYDDAQSLYPANKKLGFSLSSVGINARGRSTVLKINYRNTDEILSYAYQFARKWLTPQEASDDNMPLLEPECAGRSGPEPAIRIFKNFNEEAANIAHYVRSIADRGTPWAEIAITYRSNWMGQKILQALQTKNIPVHWLKDKFEKRKISYSDSRVKLMTMHSSKGLEFPLVIVAGTGDMPTKHSDVTTDAKLLYVAMTRATDKLLITGHKRSEFVERLLK